MAFLSSLIVRCDSGVDSRSLGIFASGLLVKLFGGIYFVCRLAIFSFPTCAHQRATSHECVHGTHQFAVLSSSVISRIFCQSACRTLGDVRGDAFVYVGLTDYLCMESCRLGNIWPRDLPRLDGQPVLVTMVSSCCTTMVGDHQHCRYVGVCHASGLVVEAIKCFLYLASPYLAIT